jgi:transposase
MASAVVLRDDFDGAGLRRLARLSGDANQVRRLLALAVIYDGGSRCAAADVGGVGLQTVRDWVLRFNANGPLGLLDGKAPGPRPVLGAEHKQALAAVIEQGPIPASHGVVRWRIVDLIQWLFDEYGVSVSKQTLSRELRAMGYRKLTARPRHHTQDADAIPAFKKTSPPKWQRSKRHSQSVRPWSCGGRMKPGSARRTASRGDGHGGVTHQ